MPSLLLEPRMEHRPWTTIWKCLRHLSESAWVVLIALRTFVLTAMLGRSRRKVHISCLWDQTTDFVVRVSRKCVQVWYNIVWWEMYGKVMLCF